MQKRGCDMAQLQIVIDTLLRQEPLEEKHKNHKLTGDYEGFWECHVEPDWLFIYLIDGTKLILTATRTGTHADLF